MPAPTPFQFSDLSSFSTWAQWGSIVQENLENNLGWKGVILAGTACIGILMLARSVWNKRNYNARVEAIKTCSINLENFSKTINGFLPPKPNISADSNLSDDLLEAVEFSQKEIKIQALYKTLEERSQLLEKLNQNQNSISLQDDQVKAFQAEVGIIKAQITDCLTQIIVLDSEECRARFTIEPNSLSDDEDDNTNEDNSVRSSSSSCSRSSMNSTKEKKVTRAEAEKNLRKALVTLERLEANLKEEQEDDTKVTALYKRTRLQIKEVHKWGTIYQVISTYHDVKKLVERAPDLLKSTSLMVNSAKRATALAEELFTLQNMTSAENYHMVQRRLKELNDKIEFLKESFKNAEIAHELSIQALQQSQEQKKQEVYFIQQQAQGFDTPISLKQHSKTWQARLDAAQARLKELASMPSNGITEQEKDEITRLGVQVQHYQKGVENDNIVGEMEQTIKTFLQSLRNKRSLDNALLTTLESLERSLSNGDNIAINLAPLFAASSAPSTLAPLAPPAPPTAPPLALSSSSKSPVSLKIEEIVDAEYHSKRQELKNKVETTFDSFITKLKKLKKASKEKADATITEPVAALNAEFKGVSAEIESLLKELAQKEAAEKVKLQEEAKRKNQAEQEAKAFAKAEADRIAVIKKQQSVLLDKAKANIEPVITALRDHINTALGSAKIMFSRFTDFSGNIEALSKAQENIASLKEQLVTTELQFTNTTQLVKKYESDLGLLQTKWELYSNSQKALIPDTEREIDNYLLKRYASEISEKEAEVRYGTQLNEALTKIIANLKLKLQAIRSQIVVEQLKDIQNSEHFVSINTTLETLRNTPLEKRSTILSSTWDRLASAWEKLQPLFEHLPLENKAGNKRKHILTTTGIGLDNLFNAFDNVQKALKEVTVNGKEKKTHLSGLTTALERISAEIAALLNKPYFAAPAHVNVAENQQYSTKFSEIIQTLEGNQAESNDTETTIENKLAAVDHAITTLKFVLDTLGKEVTDLRNEEAKKQKEVAQLKQDQEAIKAARNEVQLSETEVLQEMHRLQAALQTQTAILNIEKKKLTNLDAEIKTLKARISQAESTKVGISKKLQGKNQPELEKEKKKLQDDYEQALLNYVRQKLESEYAQEILAEVNQFNEGGVMFDGTPLIETEQEAKTTEEKTTDLAFNIAKLLSQYGFNPALLYEKAVPSNIAGLEISRVEPSSNMRLNSTIENMIANFLSFIKAPSLETYVSAKAALVAFNKMNDSGELQGLLTAAKTTIEKSTDPVQTSSAIGSSAGQGNFVKAGRSAMSTAGPANMMQELQTRISKINLRTYNNPSE